MSGVSRRTLEEGSHGLTVEVKVVEAELLKGQVELLLSLAGLMRRVPKLGRDEKLFALDDAWDDFLQRTTDLVFPTASIHFLTTFKCRKLASSWFWYTCARSRCRYPCFTAISTWTKSVDQKICSCAAPMPIGQYVRRSQLRWALTATYQARSGEWCCRKTEKGPFQRT